MKKQSGFTLIELIIVIVILGILAVTVAPQFFNFGSDARQSTVRGMEGSVRAAADMVYARAAVNGIEGNDEGTVLLSGSGDGTSGTAGTVDVVYGYPAATAEGIIAALNADIEAEADADGNDWYFVEVSGSTAIRIFPRGQENTADCYVEYTPAVGSGDSMTTRALVSALVTGC